VNVAVCEYGAGNVRSVLLAFERLGATARATSDPADVRSADLAVLPGVGSARSAMTRLQETGLDDALRGRRGATLGICLGLQLALEQTDEDGGVQGLGLVPGFATRIETDRVPRIGWSTVDPGGESYWFAHSYAAVTPAAVSTSEGVVAEARWGTFTGVQFHPEKSGRAGARWLERCLSRV
jgi:imidazole glycerol-phosphate synthase subunit HisH